MQVSVGAMQAWSESRAGVLLVGTAFALGAVCAGAQQITGTPGSPSATMTIQGDQIPAPPQKFGGKIERTTVGSKPYWPARIVPPKGAPNVLLIMTDDSGYGVPSTFGGVIPTPALDRIAANGLRYTNFNSTALCSPTRAALITGRNHHSVGFGVVAEQATGYPGYDSFITKDKATIGRILKDNGYRTSWFGKNHNTPAFQASSDRPVRPVADRHGLRVFLRLHGRRHQPVAAGEPRAQHDVHLSVRRQPELQPDHRDGRRGDRLHEPGQYADARPAVLRLLRARRHARAASSDAGVDQEDQRHAPLRRGLEQAARADLRQPEEARRDPAGREADAVAEGPAEGLGPAHARTRRRCSSARSTSSPRTSPTPTTRSAASSRRSRTWASSTTR